MSVSRDQFHKICVQCRIGKPFEPPPGQSAVFNNQRRIAELWIDGRRRSTLPGKVLCDIEFDFFGSGQFNGIATIIDGSGFIGLARGAVSLPYELFNRILSDPRLLPEVGDCSKEVEEPLDADGIFSDFNDLLFSRRGRTVPFRTPRDFQRAAFADLCRKIAFVVTHEIAHIANGHLGRAEAHHRAWITESASAVSDSELGSLTSQAMEMDADSSATNATLLQVLKLLDDCPAGCRPFLDTPEKVYFLWNFALAGLFHIWGIRISVSDLQRQHPPPAMRYFFAGATATTAISVQSPDQADAFGGSFARSFEYMQQALRVLGSNATDSEPLALRTTIMNPIAIEHQEKIFEAWDKIRDDLAKAAVARIAPKRPSGYQPLDVVGWPKEHMQNKVR